MDAKGLAGLAKDGDFVSRVGYYATKAAVSIMSESDQTANHADRLVWAKKVLTGAVDPAFPLAVLTNPTIAAGAPTISDGDLEFTVNSLVDAFAG